MRGEEAARDRDQDDGLVRLVGASENQDIHVTDERRPAPQEYLLVPAGRIISQRHRGKFYRAELLLADADDEQTADVVRERGDILRQLLAVLVVALLEVQVAALLDAPIDGGLDVLDSELVDRSAEDRLDTRQPDGHRDSVDGPGPAPQAWLSSTHERPHAPIELRELAEGAGRRLGGPRRRGHLVSGAR